MQFAKDSHVELLRAMSRKENDTDTPQGCAPPPPQLAFLPNLMPTYVTEHEDAHGEETKTETKTVHMFSLVHQTPDVQQGWRLLLRGDDLQPVLADKTTIQILELVQSVDWKPIPGSNNKGTLGVYFHVPDSTTMLRIKHLTQETNTDQIIAKLEDLSVATSAEEERDAGTADTAADSCNETLDIQVLVEQTLE